MPKSTNSKSLSKENSDYNPLEDEDFSKITKNEILYWSQKLKISPTKLFQLRHEHLVELLEKELANNNGATCNELEEKTSLNNFVSAKNKLIKHQKHNRLRGGGMRNIWEILAEAGEQIEKSLLKNSQCYNEDEGIFDDTYESSYERTYDDTYDTSNSCAFPTDLTYTLSDEDISLEETTFEDSFNIDRNLASTAYLSFERKLPVNDTYTCAGPSQTFNIPQNRTYNCPNNATYAVNRTRNKSADYNTFESDASNYHSTKYDGMQNKISPHSLAKNFAGPLACPTSTPVKGSGRSGTYSNVTDYSMSFSADGSIETVNSISIQRHDESSGTVSAQYRSNLIPSGTPNATYNAGNATYNAGNATYNTACPRALNATSNKSYPRASNATYNASYNGVNGTYNMGNSSNTVGNGTYNTACPNGTYSINNNTYNDAAISNSSCPQDPRQMAKDFVNTTYSPRRLIEKVL